MSSSSDLTISSDWDVIEYEIPQLVSDENRSEEATSENLTENLQKGSSLDDIIPEQEVISTQEHSNVLGVVDVTSSEINNHHENSSSSEFDVLDEAIEDNQSNLSFSHMEYSISSLESSRLSLVREAEVEDDLIEEASSGPDPIREYNRNLPPFWMVVSVTLGFIAFLYASPLGSIKQMKERMSALKTENEELKNLVLSKLGNDKILVALEEQIKSLKDENFKLGESMKALVTQFEEQTTSLKKEKQTKAHDPYRNEIQELKEEIAILMFGNEQMQQELTRIRFGIFSPHVEESKETETPSSKEREDKTNSEENPVNSSDYLMEEINELRKRLYTEVERLKNWKDSVQHIVKKLVKDNGEEHSKNKKPISEKEKASKPDKKDNKFSDWSWRGVKKNLKDTFEGLQDIDVPNMFSNYVDRKKIEGVFESVNHYFKKAQEKTKKVLNFNSEVNDEVWYFFGQLKNQWHDVKNKYFQKYYPTKLTPPKAEERKFKMPTKEEIKNFETDQFYETQKPKETSNEIPDQHLPLGKPYQHLLSRTLDQHLPSRKPDLESFTTSASTETSNSRENEMASEDKETNEDNSWIFKRAAHRSQLREEEQESFINWFLKRGQDFHSKEFEAIKEYLKEKYRNGNSDEE